MEQTVSWMEGISTEQRLQWLRQYNDFSEEGGAPLCRYELGQRALCRDVLEEYGLDQVVQGKSGLERMFALLDWVCGAFRHEGVGRLPAERDPRAIVEQCKAEGGTNCRGLSLLLAQLLRAYGTPARHVTCLPYQDVFRDCHVVVEAYWREQGQWVMLDPTYCLAVRDGTGRWLSLWDLRKAIEQGGALVPRETICYNGGPYTIEEYRAYMAKNLFRFALVKELVHGGDGEQTLLEPRGYSSELVPQQERSHSAAAFWAAP